MCKVDLFVLYARMLDVAEIVSDRGKGGAPPGCDVDEWLRDKADAALAACNREREGQ